MERLRRFRFFAALLVLAFFLFHLPAVIRGVQSGLAVCAVSILPSLFFFAVAASLTVTLSAGDLRPFSTKAAVFLLGTLCGFPIGAIVCEALCKSRTISEKEAARLLPFVNNASPAFLLGAVGSLFCDSRIGSIVFVSQLAAAFVCCLPIRIRKCRDAAATASPPPLPDAFFAAVDGSVRSMLRITALVCLFSALLTVLHGYISNGIAFAALAVLLEIGNGAACCAALAQAAPCAAVLLCAFGCGFSGLCVHMQVLSVLKSVRVNYFHFALGKVAVGLLTAIFAFCLCKFVLGY